MTVHRSNSKGLQALDPRIPHEVGDADRQHLLACLDVIAVGGREVLADGDGFHVPDQTCEAVLRMYGVLVGSVACFTYIRGVYSSICLCL